MPSPTTAAVQTNGGAAAEGGDEEALALPAPPLSLADIAQVTLPVLDELFPPGSGIQVKRSTRVSSLRCDRARRSAWLG